MEAVNKNSDSTEDVVTSRYSLVIAAAKRARQLIDNADSDVEDFRSKKPLSVAVEELYTGKVKILPPDESSLVDDNELLAEKFLDFAEKSEGIDLDESSDEEDPDDFDEDEEAGSEDEDEESEPEEED